MATIDPFDFDNEGKYFLLKTKSMGDLGSRDENGNVQKFFITDDIGVLQSSTLLQNLNPNEFKSSLPSPNTAWINALNAGSLGDGDVMSSFFYWKVSWTVVEGDSFATQQNFANAFLNQGVFWNPTSDTQKSVSAGWDGLFKTKNGITNGSKLVNGTLSFFLPLISQSSTVGFTEADVKEFLEGMQTSDYTQLPGGGDTSLSDLGAENIIDAINRLISRSSTSRQSMFEDPNAPKSFDQVVGSISNIESSFEAYVGKVFSEGAGQVLFNYTNKSDAYSAIIQNYLLISGMALTGLKDTPTGYLGYSGDYLVVNDTEDGIHFTGIEKIAQDLIDYGFEAGGGLNYFTGLEDTPTGYLSHSGEYLVVSDHEDGVVFTGIEKIAQDLIDYGFEAGGGSNYFTGLQDTPTGYLSHSGEYLVVSDNENGVSFTGIEKIAQDLEKHGLKVIPREFNELPTPALDYNGEIIRVGCALYYSCNGEWEMVSSLGSAAGCVDNLDELSDYEAYKEQFFAEQLADSFIDSFDNNESNNTETQTFEVCLTVNPKGFGHTALIDETGYRFGLFDGIQTVNITATPNNNKAFLRWEGAGATLGDSTSQQTTLLVDKDLFVTGYFEADENPNTGAESSFLGDALVLKDSFPTSSAPLSGGDDEFFSDLSDRVVMQGYFYDERRIDKYGVMYGRGYDSSHYDSTGTVTFRTLTIQLEVDPLYNLSRFYDAGTILVDAIRFRCKRGTAARNGFFGIARLFFVKGTDTYNIEYPQIKAHYSGYDYEKYATNPASLQGNWAWIHNRELRLEGMTNYQKYVFGYGGLDSSLLFTNNSSIGSEFISDQVFACEDSAAETCSYIDIAKTNSLYENIVENDPLGIDSSKTPGTSWAVFNLEDGSGDTVEITPDQSFSTIINQWVNTNRYEGSMVGIKGDIDMPEEVYYTFFFKTPMDFTDLQCMSYNVLCDQQEADVTFEFRIAN